MSIFDTTQIPKANPKILKQIKGETLRDYQMFLDYCSHRDFSKLSKKYSIQIRQLYNIKEKNFWKSRMQKLEIQFSNAFLVENFAMLYRHNIQKRENLICLSINLQDRLSKFMEDLTNAPISHDENYQPTQQEIIKTFHQQTRALHGMQKLAQLIEEQLKKFQIDTNPEVLSTFEREVILGQEMLNYFDDHDSVFEFVETSEIPKNPVIEPFLPIKGGASSLAEGVCEPKQTETVQIPQTNPNLVLAEKLVLDANLFESNKTVTSSSKFNQPILTNHKKQANNKLVKKIKSLTK